jgi:hypothetical protein
VQAEVDRCVTGWQPDIEPGGGKKHRNQKPPAEMKGNSSRWNATYGSDPQDQVDEGDAQGEQVQPSASNRTAFLLGGLKWGSQTAQEVSRIHAMTVWNRASHTTSTAASRKRYGVRFHGSSLLIGPLAT